ncbi:single-stranded DNA-binding protein [Virgibacillus siamensis]|uniref:single-stranded DNA-binding protein n=1 Tax=Virgibacillus siamensis TaxID=480071 RepID=UPI0009855865|nr:single-stranded DNA-binding protein [Virgibacillus siamensis]
MNSVNLVGRLTKDPEIKVTDNGTYISSFTVAVNRPYAKEETGQQADFVNCRAFNKVAQNLAEYQRKGNLISLEGKLNSYCFSDDNGENVFMLNVVAQSITYLEKRVNARG